MRGWPDGSTGTLVLRVYPVQWRWMGARVHASDSGRAMGLGGGGLGGVLRGGGGTVVRTLDRDKRLGPGARSPLKRVAGL